MSIISKRKYFYYFRGTLRSHVHFFEALKNVFEKNDVPLRPITFMNFSEYFRQLDLVRKYRKKDFLIYPAVFHPFFSFLYFFIAISFSSQSVVHLKKRKPDSFHILKKIFGKKLLLITDLEGDLISEKKFLSDTAFTDRTYADTVSGLINKERRVLNIYDVIFVQNSFFKQLLKKRHTEIEAEIKVSHLMSFEKGKFYYDQELRNSYKEKLNWQENHIMTFIGNAHYPWQNTSKTIRLYKKIKEELFPDIKLLLLIRNSDHHIVKGFLDKYQLNREDYYLGQVDHNEMNGYLNASDVGVVLRDFHEMNRVVTSGKLLDYISSGLPVITTAVFGEMAQDIEKRNFGLVLKHLDIDKIENTELAEVFSLTKADRRALSEWANENYSLDVTVKNYIQRIKKAN